MVRMAEVEGLIVLGREEVAELKQRAEAEGVQLD